MKKTISITNSSATMKKFLNNKAIGAASDGMFKANDNLRKSVANFIQKRGFTYTGDTHNSWGLRAGFGVSGGHGTGPYWNERELINGFSLQPFGIGANGLLGNTTALTPSIFASSGSSTRYSKTTHTARLKMAMAVEAYKGFGVVKNVIDLMCNFASEGIKIIHSSPAVQRFYERWAEIVGLQSRTKDIFRHYYKHSNVFIYTTMGRIDDITNRKMKSTRGSQDSDLQDSNDPNRKKRQKDIDEESGKPIGQREIPWRYTILNPFQMDIRGSKFFGEQEWVFILDEDTKADVESKKTSKYTDVLDETDINLPPSFKNMVEKDGYTVKLDQSRLWTMHYMKDDYEDWADPMVWPVMNDIMYKNQLRAMDMSVTNSVINAITIFKLGNIKDGFIAPKEHYKKLAEMLRTPSYSHNIIWNDGISMESNYPPIEKILSIEKYKSVDKDILAGLGVPSVLVDGASGGNFSNAFLQVRTLLERLEEGRAEVLKWINSQLRHIAQVMGHREIPRVKFGQMSLRDEKAEKSLIIQLLDRNIISAERVHEVFDIETQIEIERMRREKDMADKEELMVKFGPYKDPMNFMDVEDTMEKEFEQDKEKLKMQQQNQNKMNKLRQTNQPGQRKPVTKPNGRPGGTTGIPQNKKRETKPKGMGLGHLIPKATAVSRAIEEVLTELTLETKNVKYKKSLSKEDRDCLCHLATHLSLATNPDEVSASNIDRQYILSLLSEPKVPAQIVNIFNEVLSGESIEDYRQARAVAMAIYYSDGD